MRHLDISLVECVKGESMFSKKWWLIEVLAIVVAIVGLDVYLVPLYFNPADAAAYDPSAVMILSVAVSRILSIVSITLLIVYASKIKSKQLQVKRRFFGLEPVMMFVQGIILAAEILIIEELQYEMAHLNDTEEVVGHPAAVLFYLSFMVSLIYVVITTVIAIATTISTGKVSGGNKAEEN